MIDEQRAAFEAWAAQFDTYSDEYQDMGADQYFIAGYQAALDSPEVQALRDALWVATEHNALHFGESHNTVIQGRAALITMEKQK